MTYRNLFNSFFVLLFAGMAYTMPVFAQNEFVLKGKRKQQSISFEKRRGLIIVPMYLNGKGPFNFILDTGVGTLIITDASLKDRVGLKFLRQMEIIGLGSEKSLAAYSTSFLNLRIGRAVNESVSAAIIAEDVFNLSQYLGMPIHGLLGYDFFKNFLVRINYNAGILKIYTTRKRRIFKDRVKIPLELIDKKPYLNANIKIDSEKGVLLKLLIDSGSGHPLSLESFNSEPFQLPKDVIPASLGVGLGGKITGFKGRISELELSGFKLKEVLASFPSFDEVGIKTVSSYRNGSIGNPLLSRFELIFDYQNEALYLRGTAALKKPFKSDMSGMELIAVGDKFNRYIVSNVTALSAAADFGVLEGDEILRLNFNGVAQLSLDEVTKLFSSAENRIVFIELKRGNEIIVGMLKLKKQI